MKPKTIEISKMFNKVSNIYVKNVNFSLYAYNVVQNIYLI